MDKHTQAVIDHVVKHAVVGLAPSRIILFGSRARGDAGQYSDFDIAFEFDPVKYGKHWGAFCVEMLEQAPTLLSMDLVDMNDISEAFKTKINQEGIIVYSRDKKE